MDSFPDCRCLICYREGKFATFAPKSASANYELECPECLNNDSDYIEILHPEEIIAVCSEAGEGRTTDVVTEGAGGYPCTARPNSRMKIISSGERGPFSSAARFSRISFTLRGPVSTTSMCGLERQKR